MTKHDVRDAVKASEVRQRLQSFLYQGQASDTEALILDGVMECVKIMDRVDSLIRARRVT